MKRLILSYEPSKKVAPVLLRYRRGRKRGSLKRLIETCLMLHFAKKYPKLVKAALEDLVPEEDAA